MNSGKRPTKVVSRTFRIAASDANKTSVPKETQATSSIEAKKSSPSTNAPSPKTNGSQVSNQKKPSQEIDLDSLRELLSAAQEGENKATKSRPPQGKLIGRRPPEEKKPLAEKSAQPDVQMQKELTIEASPAGESPKTSTVSSVAVSSPNEPLRSNSVDNSTQIENWPEKIEVAQAVESELSRPETTLSAVPLSSQAVESAVLEEQAASVEPPAPVVVFDESELEEAPLTDGSELGIVNKNFVSTYKPEKVGITDIGEPEELIQKLAAVGYHCQPFYAAQVSLLLNTPSESIRSLLLEGPSGCGKSFLAKSLAKITGAELMCIQCFRGMPLQNLIEYPSTLGMAASFSGNSNVAAEKLLNLGIISRAFLASQDHPVILLIDEIDKVDVSIDTFFLGPIQDSRVWLESRAPIDARVDNLLIVFTKNFERALNDALLRRVQPLRMTYMDSALERRVLSPYCDRRLIDNLVRIADIMRHTDGSYLFERPPAPEELLRIGRYVTRLLKWGKSDYSFVGQNVWHMISKSEHDRAVLEFMLRYHPDFFDPLVPDGRKATLEQVYARLGRVILSGLVNDPDAEKRAKAYKPEQIGLTKVGTPQELARKLKVVGYECLPFLATQVSLLLNTPSERVRGLLLEGPSGCGKSFLAKCLAKICGAEFLCLSCYKDMNINHLIEVPSSLAMARSMVEQNESSKEKLMNLGIISKAFLKSQSQPVVLLVDEIDKVEGEIDTFFLGPLQDGRIWLESRPPIDCNLDNILFVFTKNYVRNLSDALLRRLQPVRMTYLNSTLERNILSKHCLPQLVANLVSVADRMRDSGGSYQFERPPAPEELLSCGHYVARLLVWNAGDFSWVGRNVWAMLAKSEHDRAVLEHMLRFHPDFIDPLIPDGRNAKIEDIYARLGRVVLKDIVADPDALRRERAWEDMEYNN